MDAVITDVAACADVEGERRTRGDVRVRAGFLQYLKDPTISPILTSTLIAAGTVSFNLVAGLVTEKKRADLTLEVPNLFMPQWSLWQDTVPVWPACS